MFCAAIDESREFLLLPDAVLHGINQWRLFMSNYVQQRTKFSRLICQRKVEIALLRTFQEISCSAARCSGNSVACFQCTSPTRTRCERQPRCCGSVLRVKIQIHESDFSGPDKCKWGARNNIIKLHKLCTVFDFVVVHVTIRPTSIPAK